MDRRRLALIRSGGTGEGRLTVGSGYLIAPRLVLTARHVLEDRVTGTLWPAVTVRVGHHLDGEATSVDAELLWVHPAGLDVALLRIDRKIDLPGSVRWGCPAGTAPLPYEGLGYPWAAKGETRAPEHLRGVLPVLSGGKDRYVLDQGPAPTVRTDGGNAWGGASGAAIFCGGHLVGVVTEEDHAYGARRLIALPASSFARDGDFASYVEEQTGRSPEPSAIGASLPEAGPAVERTPAERELETLLAPLFSNPGVRVDHARALARELGYVAEGYEPTAADLVALLMAHPRAIASLGEALASGAQGAARAALTHLFSWVRALDCGSLLSVNEYDVLIGLLRRVCEKQPTLLPRTAAEALRYVVLPEILTRPLLGEEDVCGVVEGLEDLSDGVSGTEGAPPVPALLRLVEYVAAATDARLGDDLRAWSGKTAQRLGIHDGALGERRADAAQWAKCAASPVTRVVMELAHDPDVGDDRYRVRILLVRDDGSYRVLKEAESEPKTPREAADSLSEAVFAAAQEPGQGDHVPWVTVVVDRAGLDLAVDEWEPGARDDILPAWPIGAEYSVSLSCPELSDRRPERDGDRERRWKNGRASVLVTSRTSGDSRQLVNLLKTKHRDTARVILHGPADETRSWLLTCLVLGVPVVLWDREATGYEDAGKLEVLAPAGDLEGLPGRLRDFRSDLAACPAERRARPSLVWEPEGCLPRTESLQLSDPWRGSHAS
ncbi:trypsin-like peptidase domain-containing protein [Streptomyces canus]|uniref:VMAP-C domain-containing protein n=1 Tax=Streptomyces canus TaxID=58343 RepID=UPI002DDC36BE|nr:trypsin-like peptidase domain-containing protein [Streptomyces canus]MCX5058994.1 serine protease [Streptomyces sp. NBC_00452]WSD90469.1 serine protease [Streptomyces canus]